MMPRIKVSTGIRAPSITNIFEPWVLQARCDTGKVSVSLTRPSFSRWKRSSSVISLLIDAGGDGVTASFAHSTCPVWPSISSACSAAVSMAAAALPAPRTVAMLATNKSQRRRKGRIAGTPSCCELLIDDDFGVAAAKPGEPGERRIGGVDIVVRADSNPIEKPAVPVD